MVHDVNNDVLSSRTHFALDLIKFPVVLELSSLLPSIAFANVAQIRANDS